MPGYWLYEVKYDKKSRSIASVSRMFTKYGEMAEWSNAVVLKTIDG